MKPSLPNQHSVLEQQQDTQNGHEEEAPRPAAGPRLCRHAHRYHAHVDQGQNVGRQECRDQKQQHGHLQAPVLKQQRSGQLRR